MPLRSLATLRSMRVLVAAAATATLLLQCKTQLQRRSRLKRSVTKVCTRRMASIKLWWLTFKERYTTADASIRCTKRWLLPRHATTWRGAWAARI